MANLQLRKGTALQWAAANPVLKIGEPGAEWDTYKLKIGDGVTAWNSLAYVGGGGSGTVTTTGSPASGNLAAFSGATSVTNTNLTGAVTTAGGVATTLANNIVGTGNIVDANVTLAKIANAAANSKLLGSGSAGSGAAYSELTLGTALSMSGTTLNVSGATAGLDARSSVYPPFTPSGVDAEFTGSDLAGFTLVNDGGATLATNTESNDMLSIKLPGGDTGLRLQAYMKAATCNTGDILEVCFNGAGLAGNFQMFGLIFANGATYGAGAQVCYSFLPNSGTQTLQLFAHTNYNTQGTNTAVNGTVNAQGARFLRLKYEAANSFSGWVSSDGISWANVTGALARTLTPTHVGFYATTGSATGQMVWNVRYFKKTT